MARIICLTTAVSVTTNDFSSASIISTGKSVTRGDHDIACFRPGVKVENEASMY